MLLNDFLTNSAQKYPNKVALIYRDQRLTYGDLEQQSIKLAHALIDLGVTRGDRVAIFLDNSIESVIALFGILKADAIFVMLNAALKAKKFEYILNDCGAKVLITHKNKHRIFDHVADNISSLAATIAVGDEDGQGAHVLPWAQSMASFPDHPPKRQNIDVDLAAIIYTSGSTGDPKGVTLTHLNMVSAANSITTYLQNTPDDIIMNILPLSFDYGLYQILMAAKFGGTVVLEKSFLYPYAVIEKMIQEKVTGFPVVPTIAAMLLQLENLRDYDFSSFRYITNTAAVLPESYIRRLREIFPHVAIYSMYGLTECKRVSYLPPAQLDRRPNSVGHAMPNVEVYIVNEYGNRVGPGVAGELVVRGSNVMKGYWNAPEETDKVLRPGPYPGEKVLYTGDLFKMDEEGYLYFVARKDDLIKTRGERVSPREIENAICQIDDVSEAAVVGVPDEILGQAIKAFILPGKDNNLREKDIVAYCMNNLEFFMVPKYIQFVNKFPRTSSGKIDKKKLKADCLLPRRHEGHRGGDIFHLPGDGGK